MFGPVSHDSPVTCEEAQAGRTDFITEDVQLQSCLSLLLQLWLGSHVDLPCRRLVHNPPLLNVFSAVVRPLQVQQNALIALIWHRGIDEMHERPVASVFKSHRECITCIKLIDWFGVWVTRCSNEAGKYLLYDPVNQNMHHKYKHTCTYAMHVEFVRTRVYFWFHWVTLSALV